MWTYSIEYDEPATISAAVPTEMSRSHGSTMVTADSVDEAIRTFRASRPMADVSEIRRVRHD